MRKRRRKKQGWLKKLYHSKIIKFISGIVLWGVGGSIGIGAVTIGFLGPSILVLIIGSLIGFILWAIGTYWIIEVCRGS